MYKTKHTVDGKNSTHVLNHVNGVSNMVIRFFNEYGIDFSSLEKKIGQILSLNDVVVQMHKNPHNVKYLQTPTAVLSLMPKFNVRPYQKKAVNSVFLHATLHNRLQIDTCTGGIIIAPCGSGKTTMGAEIISTNARPFLILTTRYSEQWVKHIREVYTIKGKIIQLTSNISVSDIIGKEVVGLVSTYQTYSACQRSTAVLMFETILWNRGIVVLDEVHAAAAKSYFKIVQRFRKHNVVCCGLTATLVREDEELPKLTQSIGEIKTEVCRNMLVKEGYVMDVKCTNIIVPCSDKQLLQNVKNANLKSAIMAISPEKMLLLSIVIQFLIQEKHHILVFCDDLCCLEFAFKNTQTHTNVTIFGPINMFTPESERLHKITNFSNSTQPCVLFISRTGDEAIDIPNASATLTFWNHWKSRRQIVQRLGRISRPSNMNSVAYVLLLDVPKEIQSATHRNTYLEMHGFHTTNKKVKDTVFWNEYCKQYDENNMQCMLRQTLQYLLPRINKNKNTEPEHKTRKRKQANSNLRKIRNKIICTKRHNKNGSSDLKKDILVGF